MEKVTNGARLALLQQAMLEGHCAESRTAVHNSHGSPKRLMEAYLYYIKECTRKDFPSIEQLRTHFGAAVQPFGGWIDAEGELEAQRRMVFVGKSQCSTTLTKYNIHQFWLRHESQLSVSLTDHSHLHIDCFEESSVVINAASPDCRCKVRLYGNSRISIVGYAECVSVERTNLPTYPQS